MIQPIEMAEKLKKRAEEAAERVNAREDVKSATKAIEAAAADLERLSRAREGLSALVTAQLVKLREARALAETAMIAEALGEPPGKSNPLDRHANEQQRHSALNWALGRVVEREQPEAQIAELEARRDWNLAMAAGWESELEAHKRTVGEALGGVLAVEGVVFNQAAPGSLTEAFDFLARKFREEARKVAAHAGQLRALLRERLDKNGGVI